MGEKYEICQHLFYIRETNKGREGKGAVWKFSENSFKMAITVFPKQGFYGLISNPASCSNSSSDLIKTDAVEVPPLGQDRFLRISIS